MQGFGSTNLNNGFIPSDVVSISKFNPNRLKMDRAGTIEDFGEVVLRAIKYFQKQILHRAPKTWVPVIANYPLQKIYPASQASATAIGPQRVTFDKIARMDDYYHLYPFADLVTYTLRFQSPAGSKKAFGTERIRNLQLRETLQVKEQPGMFYDVMSATTDNLFQFDCWASNGRGADHLASWFKYFMEFMKDSIKRQGFQKVEFWERGIDKDITAWRDDIAVRSLQYLVRAEEFYIVPRTIITTINAEIQLRYDMDEAQNEFIREMAGMPMGSGCLDPETVPLISGLQSIGTINLIDGC
jgi:hypothetical protein